MTNTILLNKQHFNQTSVDIFNIRRLANLSQFSRKFNDTRMYMSDTYIVDTRYATGQGLLIDLTNNKILAIQYNYNNLNSLFFANGGIVIRISHDFITNDVYKKLFTSFKRHILKPINQQGALFELAMTHSDMAHNLINKLNFPAVKTITELNNFKNLILENAKQHV